MKKLLSLILVFAVLLPVVSLASDIEIDFYYGYAHMELTTDGAPFMSVIYFAEDHACYYLAQLFRHDEPGIGRAYVGTWEYTDEGYVYAKIGENTDITFKLVSIAGSLSLVDRSTMQVYEQFDILMN